MTGFHHPPHCRFVLILHGILTARAAKSTGRPLQDSVLPVPLAVISRLIRPVRGVSHVRTNQQRSKEMVTADLNNVIARRIVEITDQDDDTIINFVDLDFDILRRHP
jgi:hypothetical protein